MKSIRIEKLSKTYDSQEKVLENLNLTIPSGKFFALLGPSGCGKTTILRAIAGFESVDSGKIYLGTEDITNEPINKRRINTVFQNYALFPHMNVFENVAYSQVIKGISPKKIKEKVEKILETVNLSAHINKPISQLSGGQQQRIALARAIINDPEVLLLDEPLAALDVKLREKMLIELIDIQEKLKTTFVYVTHDQSEALTVADQMAIMNYDGEIEQIGIPKDIYEFPVSKFVAQFVGTTNVFKGKLHKLDNELYIDIPNFGKIYLDSSKFHEEILKEKDIEVGIRPEKIFLSKIEKPGFANVFTGIVESIVYHGRSTEYIIRLENNEKIKAFEQNEEHFLTKSQEIDYDDKIYLYWQKENMMIFKK